MPDYKKIAELALKKAIIKNKINEGIKYPEGLKEKMHPVIEKEFITHKHSLGNHPIFPEDDIHSFEEKILGERFAEVVNRYKRVNELDSVDETELKKSLMPLVTETMQIELKHRKELTALAVKMVREEFDMGEDVVDINAELTSHFKLDGTSLNPTPSSDEEEFDSHDEIVEANEEVYKRRFINAMIQGAAKKCNQMFHMVEEELTEIDPRLPNKYAKMMATVDYMYYIIPNLKNGHVGGIVRVDFPSKKNPKAVINAEAMVFPVLIHELVKGVMELISANGLPKKKKLANYVINKADFLMAEPGDMRIGPALWGRFTKLIDPDDFKLKHHIYSELISLPVREFNKEMKEIMAGTKTGKKIIKQLVDSIKSDLQSDELDEALNEYSTQESNTDLGFNWDELKDTVNPNDEEDDGFDWDELKGIV